MKYTLAKDAIEWVVNKIKNNSSRIDKLESQDDSSAWQTEISTDGNTITETRNSEKKITTFDNDTTITMKHYTNNALDYTKTTTFNSDGTLISEEIT